MYHRDFKKEIDWVKKYGHNSTYKWDDRKVGINWLINRIAFDSDNPEGSFLPASSCEGKSSSVSDLQSPGSKVKRHGSLVNSLSSKAMRVKSRITDSFFKKGKEM